MASCCKMKTCSPSQATGKIVTPSSFAMADSQLWIPSNHSFPPNPRINEASKSSHVPTIRCSRFGAYFSHLHFSMYKLYSTSYKKFFFSNAVNFSFDNSCPANLIVMNLHNQLQKCHTRTIFQQNVLHLKLSFPKSSNLETMCKSPKNYQLLLGCRTKPFQSHQPTMIINISQMLFINIYRYIFSSPLLDFSTPSKIHH